MGVASYDSLTGKPTFNDTSTTQADLQEAANYAELRIGESVPTAGDLPTTARVGREIWVADPGYLAVWANDTTGWADAGAGIISAVTTFGPGFTSNPAPNNLRILRQGNRRTVYGEAVYGTGSSYANVFTAATQDQPPSTSSRTIGIAGIYSGSGNLLLARATLTAGVVGVAIGSGSLPSGTVYLSGLTWYMD